jgi:hypothetical protein
VLAGGAAGALIFDAPRLVALGLGTAAGAGYSYGALFHPTSRAGLYNAGAQALACVHDKGAPALAAVSTIEAQRANADPVVDQCSDDFQGCQAAKTAYFQATAEAQAFYAADAGAAEPVRQATQNVILEVNKQAEADIPDIGRVFAAASGIANIAKGFAPPKTEQAEAAESLVLARPPGQVLATLQSSTAAINTALATARDKLNTLSTPCTVEVAAEPPLTIAEQDKALTLKAGEKKDVTVSGGTQPLTVKWNGTGPAPGVLDYTYVPPRTITLAAVKTEGGPYNLLISDSKTAVNVQITLAKAQ